MKSIKEDLDSILHFIDCSHGLKSLGVESGHLKIIQSADDKVFSFSLEDVSEVLHRQDSESKLFLQINFRNSNKILLTENLVGFKPHHTLGLDMTKLPKVVTTPDLLSVYEAIEEAIGSEQIDHEIEILKKVYLSIIEGGEKVGFELKKERLWLTRLMGSKLRASA